MDLELWERYPGELYGVLVSLVEGEAKMVVKGLMGIKGEGGDDGYKALLLLQQRFDILTAAGLLQAYMDVVNPGILKGGPDAVSGIYKWEAKLAVLSSRYDGEVKEELKGSYLSRDLTEGF